jgi:glycosyltransferase involved in cell wall biosynthesis
VFDGAWRLLTITDCLRAWLLRDYQVPAERVWSVPDAGGLAGAPLVPTNGRDTLAANQRADLQRPTLVYVGQLYPHKGVDLVLQALDGVPRAELLLVGGLPDDPQRPRLEQLAAELGVRERVRFTGPRPYAEVPSLLAQARVALLPIAEGLVARCFTSPLKLFDYLAAGLPIVAVDFPTIREVLRDGHNGLLVPPNDPSAMAAAVNRLLDDPALATRLGQQAREDAAAYTWERRADRILQVVGWASPTNSPSKVNGRGNSPSRDVCRDIGGQSPPYLAASPASHPPPS